MSFRVSIQYAIGEKSQVPTRAELRKWARAALQDRRPQAEICIRIVGEAEMASLNHQYRGKDGPTNVLSFPMEALPGIDLPLLGDLVICAPVLAREAEQQRKTTDAHWAHIVIHGTLHLLGYDHEQVVDAQVMEPLECELLAHLGYPDPYLVPDVTENTP